MRIIVLPALLLVTALAFSGTVRADENLCTTTTTCTFHCHKGDTIHIQLFGDVGEQVSGDAFCGGVGILCSGVGLGPASSTGVVCSAVVTKDGTGTCTFGSGNFVACGNTLYNA